MARPCPTLFPWLLAAALAATLPAASWAGAWTQPTGAYYFRIAAAGIDTRSRYDGSGARVPFQSLEATPRDAAYAMRELRAYGEIGLSERVTGYGSLTYKSVAVEDPAARRATRGAGDLWLGSRFRLTAAGAPPVSLAFETWLPTGYDPAAQPALGTGALDGAVRVVAGLSGRGWYTTGDVGWMARGGEYADQWLATAEAGGSLARVGGRVVLRLAEAVGAPPARATGFDPARANPRMAQLDVSLGYEVGAGTRLELGIAHALRGRETLAGNTIELAVARSGRIVPAP